MNEKKLTDEEIVNAYIHCVLKRGDCDNFPYDEVGCGVDGNDLIKIINRQKAEIERLTSLYDGKSGFMTSSIGNLPLTVEGLRKAVDEISRLLVVQAELQELNAKYYNEAKDLRRENKDLQKQVDELKEKIRNLKSAMISRVAIKSYDSFLTTPDDVEEIFGDAYESEFNEHLKQTVKDTAKEILQELWDETEPLNESHKWVRLRIKNIASRKGVEVE